MKVSVLKTAQPIEVGNSVSEGVQIYGERNDYPQRIQELVAASPTGTACVELFARFVAGRGFDAKEFRTAVINRRGDTADDLLSLVARDYAENGGFALHVNYNALGEVVEVQHIPIEWVRFKSLDKGGTFNSLLVHDDWGKRFTRLRSFALADAEEFSFFDPSQIDVQVENAGGWLNYNGQVYYYSNRGRKVYPMPSYAGVLTDMSSEEGLSNVTLRNVRNNFLPAGMLIDYDLTNNSDEQENAMRQSLAQFQGDTRTGLMMHVSVQNGEQRPEWVPFKANNYDKEFTNAEDKIPEIIGRAFMQPPILRGVDVGSNFGADAMKNAYDFYNSITETDRDVISRAFAEIFSLWHDKSVITDEEFYILPKVYQVNATLAERLGANIDKVLELVRGTDTIDVKRATLSVLYGLSQDDIDALLNINKEGGAI